MDSELSTRDEFTYMLLLAILFQHLDRDATLLILDHKRLKGLSVQIPTWPAQSYAQLGRKRYYTLIHSFHIYVFSFVTEVVAG